MIETTQTKTEFWSQHLAAAKNFNGSRQSYCDAHGLKLATFYQWKKQIEGVTRPRKRPAFLPAVIKESSSEATVRALPDARWVAEVLAHLIEVTK